MGRSKEESLNLHEKVEGLNTSNIRNVVSAEFVVFKPKAKISKVFEHVIHTYLKDSNAYGNIYFTKHFEWQGVCREAWFTNCIHKDMFNLAGVFITKRANVEFCSETFPFQNIKAEMYVKKFEKNII